MNLEEGEIEDEEPFLEYSPLERPISGNLLQQSCAASALSYTSDSDSDGGCHKLPKRAKISVPEKYNVWVINENQEDLSLSMNLCGMDNSRDRAVEYYPYKLASTSVVYNFASHNPRYEKNSLNEDEGDSENRDDDCISSYRKLIYRKRKKSSLPLHDPQINGGARELKKLDVNEDDPIEKVASDIADKLNETNKEIIVRSVSVLGQRKAIKYYEETQSIEREGGLLINNLTRKRTSGGVYLFLIRHDQSVPPESMREIFSDLQDRKCKLPKRKFNKRKKTKGRGQSASSSNQGEQVLEKDELENPPPSPATEADAIPYIKSSNVHLEDQMETL